MVSNVFIPFYEMFYPKSLKAENISPIQKEVDMIFVEGEFKTWLKKNIQDKITNNTYPKYYTQENFELFLPEFKKLKKKKEFVNKKQTIFQHITSEDKFPEITKNIYDVDIVETYFNIKDLVEIDNTSEIVKERHLENALHPIRVYCSNKQMSVQKVLDLKYFIIVKSSIYNFESYLGRALIVADPNKINLILNHHKKEWKRPGSFVKFVDHLVYRFVLKNSPYDNNERLAKISGWVEKYGTLISEDGNKKVPQGSTIEYYYWPYSEEKLMKLYELLVNDNKIEKTDFFSENFKTFDEFPHNPIVWRTSNIELMYLFDLIYKQKGQYRSISLQTIANKLFKMGNKNFTSKGLNTSLLQAKCFREKGAKSSPGIKSIKNIFDSLALD